MPLFDSDDSDDESIPQILRDRAKQLAIPTAAKYCIPAATLPVELFVRYPLPTQTSDIILPKEVFSDMPPTMSWTDIMSRPIPSAYIQQHLQNHVETAMDNSKLSIKDWRKEYSEDYMPLSVIAFWRTLSEVRKSQQCWSKAANYLDGEDLLLRREDVSEDLRQEVKMTLRRMSWNEPLPWLYGARSNALAQILGTGWVDDEYFAITIRSLQDRLGADKARSSKVAIAPLEFSNELRSVMRHYKAKTAFNKQLGRTAKRILETDLETLYFPVHIRNNHWLAIVVNLRDCYYAYGEQAPKTSLGEQQLTVNRRLVP